MSNLARAAIRRLRTGVVPTWELAQLSVGYSRVRELIDRSLAELEQTGKSAPLFVRGEWGTGKTHLLSYAGATAAARWFASSRVDLNARGLALTHPQRYLPVVADNIHAGDHTGVIELIPRLINIDLFRGRLRAFSGSEYAGEIGCALRTLCTETQGNGVLGLSEHPAWAVLRGSDLSWSDGAGYRERALNRIGALARMLRAIGLKGILLLLDETETIDQLWNIRSRLGAYHVLGRLFEMDCLWCVLGSTFRFERTIQSDLSRDVLTTAAMTPPARRFLLGWQAQGYKIVEPPIITRTDARDLANTVAELYRTAHNHGGDASLHEDSIDEWMRNPVRNPRRLIRLLVHRLDISRGLTTFDPVLCP